MTTEQTKMDIVGLRSALDAIESGGHYCTFPSGNIVMWEDHFPGIRAALDELERLRAERPGWAEAIEAAAKVADEWADRADRLLTGDAADCAHQAATSIAHRIRALHPSVAEGRGEDNSAPAKSGPV